MLSVNIIASCTDRKRYPAELSLRDVAAHSPRERAATWWRRLSSHRSDRATLAVDLYQGDHWAIARQLPDVVAAHSATAALWVASAGYGLTPSDAAVHPYSATFSSGHVDSVAPPEVPSGQRSAYLRDWWEALAGVDGPARGRPRSIVDLATADPNGRIVVVASPDYVEAMESDLLAAAQNLSSPAHLIIVSGRDAFHGSSLRRHLVPADARLQHVVGGARTSLYVRVARKLLTELHRWELAADVLQARYEALLARCPEPRVFNRDRMTDAEVTAFIRRERRVAPGISCTRALRALRSSGLACEQHRFKELFHRVRG